MLFDHIAHVPGIAPKNAAAGYHRDIGDCSSDIKENLVEQVEGVLTVETQCLRLKPAKNKKMRRKMWRLYKKEK